MIWCLRAERLRLMNKDSLRTLTVYLVQFICQIRVQLWVLQESCLIKSGMASPDWHVPMFDTHLRKHLWLYCPGQGGVNGNDRADRLAGKATLTSGLRP